MKNNCGEKLLNTLISLYECLYFFLNHALNNISSKAWDGGFILSASLVNFNMLSLVFNQKFEPRTELPPCVSEHI